MAIAVKHDFGEGVSNKLDDYIVNTSQLAQHKEELKSYRPALLVVLMAFLYDVPTSIEKLGDPNDIYYSFKRDSWLKIIRMNNRYKVHKNGRTKRNTGRSWSRMPKEEKLNYFNALITSHFNERLRMIEFYLDREFIILRSNIMDVQIVQIRIKPGHTELTETKIKMGRRVKT